MEIRVDPEKPCDNRPVQVEHLRGDTWVSVGEPCSCSHEAAALVLRVIALSCKACVVGQLLEEDVLTFSDFRMFFVDDTESQPTDLTQACEILRKIGEKQ